MFLRQKLLNFASQARVETLQVKYDPASRLECTATLIDDIQYSRNRVMMNTNLELFLFHDFLLQITLISIYQAKSARSRDQLRAGSFLDKREEPGNDVV
jgi:hypothetical protein